MSIPKDAVAFFEEIIALTPDGDNPFLVAIAFFDQQLYIELPAAYFINFYILCWLYSIALLATLLVLIIRLRRRLSFVPFTLVHTPRGTLISPQTQVTFPVLTGIFLILTQVTLWRSVDVYRHHASQRNFVWWKTFIFLPLWPALVLEVWGCLITFILSSAKFTGSKRYLPRPSFINVFFISLVVGVLVSQLTTILLCNQKFNITFKSFQQIQDQLGQASTTYTGNLDPNVLTAFVEPLGEFLQRSNDFASLFRIVHICWLTYLLFIMLIYVPLAYSYIRALRNQIHTIRSAYSLSNEQPKEPATVASQQVIGNLGKGKTRTVTFQESKSHYKSMHGQIDTSTPLTPIAPGYQRITFTGSPPNSQTGFAKLRKVSTMSKVDSEKRKVIETYGNLIWSCAAILTAAALYIAQTFWIAIDVKAVLKSKIPLQINDIGSLYIYAVLGGSANVLILIRALRTYTKPPSGKEKDVNGGTKSVIIHQAGPKHISQQISIPHIKTIDMNGRPILEAPRHTSTFVQKFDASAMFGPPDQGAMVTFATPLPANFEEGNAYESYQVDKEKKAVC